MKSKHCVLAFGVVCLICCTAFAQDQAGTLLSLEFQKVKPQMSAGSY